MCGWELAALLPGTRIPTVSQTVRRHPVFGWLLLVLLTHHWYLETELVRVR